MARFGHHFLLKCWRNFLRQLPTVLLTMVTAAISNHSASISHGRAAPFAATMLVDAQQARSGLGQLLRHHIRWLTTACLGQQFSCVEPYLWQRPSHPTVAQTTCSPDRTTY